jgi:hypothetical protein
MGEASNLPFTAATEIDCTGRNGSARSCSDNFGNACRGLWPVKTAEHLATHAHISVRAANYYIAGERPPCAAAIRAAILQMLE